MGTVAGRMAHKHELKLFLDYELPFQGDVPGGTGQEGDRVCDPDSSRPFSVCFLAGGRRRRGQRRGAVLRWSGGGIIMYSILPLAWGWAEVHGQH